MLIRFKKEDGTEYPQWKKTKLKNTYSVGKAGGTPLVSNYTFYDGNINFLSISDMSLSGKYIKSTEKHISEEGLKNSSAWLLDKNSLVLSMYASYGKVCINDIELATSQAIFAMKPINEVNVEFMYQMLVQMKNSKYWESFVKTGTQPNINKQIVENAIIYLPCLEEQQKIADFLSTVDQKIEAQRVIVADYEELKKGTMKKIFNQEIRFKDDDGNEFPKWEERTLEECCDLITKGTTPKAYSNKAEDINFIKIESIKEGIVESRNCAKISKETHEKELKRSILEENDILFAIAGSLGVSVVVEKDILPANTNQALAIFRLRENILTRYIYMILNSIIMENYIKRCCTVGAQPNLSLKQMNEFKFPYPCLKEQKKIADCLSALDRKIETEKKILADLEELKKGLLQGIFNN